MAKVTLSDGREIEVREPLVRDIFAVKIYKSEEEKTARLVGNLTNMTIEEVSAIPMKDYPKFQQIVIDANTFDESAEGEEIKMREPVVGDGLAVKNFKDAEEKETRIIASLAGKSHDEIMAMTLKKYSGYRRVFQGFFS
jgi:Trm5-related predicted tRNA methylase